MYQRQFFGAINPFVGGFNPLAFGPTPFSSFGPQSFGGSPFGGNPFGGSQFGASPYGAVNPLLAHAYGSPLGAIGAPGFNPMWGAGLHHQVQSPFGIGQSGVNPFGGSPFAVNPLLQNPLAVGPSLGVNPLAISPFAGSPLGSNPFLQNPTTMNPIAAVNPFLTAFSTPGSGINPLASSLLGGTTAGIGVSGVDPITEAIASQAGPYLPIRPLITPQAQHGGLPFTAIGQSIDPITASLLQSQVLSGILNNPLLAAGRTPWAYGFTNSIGQGHPLGMAQGVVPGCI